MLALGEETGSCSAIWEFPWRSPNLISGEGVRRVFGLCENVGNAQTRVKDTKNKRDTLKNKASEPLVRA